MARNINKIPKGFNIKGVSTKRLLEMDTYGLSSKGLRNVLNRLVSTANKRIRRLEAKAPHSQALASYKRENKPFTTRGLNYNEMENMMKRVKNFLTAKTSTIKGFEADRKRVVQTIGEFESEEQESEFWDTFNDWIKKHPKLAQRFNDSFQLRDMMFDEFVTQGRTSQGTKNKITRTISKMLDENNISDAEEEKRRLDALMSDDAIEFEPTF